MTPKIAAIICLLFIPTLDYAYDSVGNMQANHQTHDNANRILSDSVYDFEHDANGNMIKKTNRVAGTSTEYFYDSGNQLVIVKHESGLIAEFKYDPTGRRIEKTIKRAGTTVTKRYVYDGVMILAILDESNAPLAIFTNGPRIDEPLSMLTPKDGKVYGFHADGLGSIVAVTDEAGNVIERIEYAAFGLPYFSDVRGATPVLSSSTFTQSPYAFTGREWDDEIELYFYRARYYCPYLGRFIQPDPAEFHPNYVYANNNPVGNIDPSGMITIPGVGWVPLGEAQGQKSAEWYADHYNRSSGLSAAGYYMGGIMASLWTRTTSDTTALTLASACGYSYFSGFYKYVNPTTINMGGPYLAGGFAGAPYGKNFASAKNALQIPTMPTGVVPVNVQFWEPVIGPGLVNARANPQWGAGGGVEYYRATWDYVLKNGWRRPK